MLGRRLAKRLLSNDELIGPSGNKEPLENLTLVDSYKSAESLPSDPRVVIINAKPKSLFICLNKSMSFAAFPISKLPVGSSANNKRGLFIKALITATLSLSPPESCEGK